VCLPLLISPCIIKSRSSLLAPTHPGGPGKRAVKWLCGNRKLNLLLNWYSKVLLFIIIYTIFQKKWPPSSGCHFKLMQYQSILLWPPYVIGQAIIFLSCGFFFFLFIYFLFFAYSQPSQIGCPPYFHTWGGRSANLGSRSETCCTWLAEITGRQKLPKIRHLSTIAQLCLTISSQLRHASTVKKNLLNSNISPTCPHNMVNVGPLVAEIGSLV